MATTIKYVKQTFLFKTISYLKDYRCYTNQYNHKQVPPVNMYPWCATTG